MGQAHGGFIMLEHRRPVILALLAVTACGGEATLGASQTAATDATLRGGAAAAAASQDPNHVNRGSPGSSGESCGPHASATAAVIGDLAHGQTVCNQRATVPVNVKGDFGTAASLTITGPSNYKLAGTAREAGKSCTYHYLWHPCNLPAGTYTVTLSGGVTGTYSFSVSVVAPCEADDDDDDDG